MTDDKNVTSRIRSGYEPVRADEYPDQNFPTAKEGKYAGVIGVGGLVLARIPTEILRQRSEYFKRLTQDQLKGVDNDLMKEQHRGMPIDIDRQSRTTFGGKKS